MIKLQIELFAKNGIQISPGLRVFSLKTSPPFDKVAAMIAMQQETIKTEKH